MDNVLHYWITSFANSQDQTFNEANDLNGTEPITLWDQNFADRHAKANATGNVVSELAPNPTK